MWAQGDVAIDDSTVDALKSAPQFCCVTRALSQQQDFLDEKPLIWTYVEEKGHICLFLQKFHC